MTATTPILKFFAELLLFNVKKMFFSFYIVIIIAGVRDVRRRLRVPRPLPDLHLPLGSPSEKDAPTMEGTPKQHEPQALRRFQEGNICQIRQRSTEHDDSTEK